MSKIKKVYPWTPGCTPDEVWDLAIERVQEGQHLVEAVLTSVFDVWDNKKLPKNSPRYQKEAPEVEALNIVRILEGAVVGIDFFKDYTVEKAVTALETAKELSP